MTPVKSGMEARVTSLESMVTALSTRVGSIEVSIAAISTLQQSNHAENRQSIHNLRDSQQTMIEQNAVAAVDLAQVKTKLDEVVGTDQGKPGKLDKMEKLIKDSMSDLGGKVERLSSTVGDVSTTSTKRDWLYELGRMIVYGAVAAAITAIITKAMH